MHYYQHNIGDYARDTGHLSVLEHGVYRLLLDWCYLNEKPITTEQAMRVGRGNPVATQSVLSEFFLETPEGWTHKRVAQEVAEYHEKRERNRKNGAKNAKKDPVGTQSLPSGYPNQEPITNNQEKNTAPRKRVAPPDGVSDSVWQDFLTHRRAKKAPVTDAALDGIRREAEKAGWSLEDALRESCARGWQGFKADWVSDNPKTYAQQAADVARVSVPSSPGPDPALQKLIADSLTAKPPPPEVRARLAELRGKA